jgi:hypothetical protein
MRLGEWHTRLHAPLLRGKARLTDDASLMRKPSQDDRLGTELRPADLFDRDPEAGNHAQMKHRTLRGALFTLIRT